MRLGRTPHFSSLLGAIRPRAANTYYVDFDCARTTRESTYVRCADALGNRRPVLCVRRRAGWRCRPVGNDHWLGNSGLGRRSSSCETTTRGPGPHGVGAPNGLPVATIGSFRWHWRRSWRPGPASRWKRRRGRALDSYVSCNPPVRASCNRRLPGWADSRPRRTSDSDGADRTSKMGRTTRVLANDRSIYSTCRLQSCRCADGTHPRATRGDRRDDESCVLADSGSWIRRRNRSCLGRVAANRRIPIRARRITRACSGRTTAQLEQDVIQSGDDPKGFDRPRRRRGSQLKPDPLYGVYE